MSRHEKLISVYKAVLNSLSIVDEGNGLLSRKVGEQTVPLMCEDKRVVLPTREVLQTLDPTTQMGFHPLCESALRGESPVIRLLRTLINHRTTMILLELMNQLLGIAMDNKRHANLTPEQKEFLKVIPEISPDCHKEFTDIAKNIKPNEREKAANIYLKRAPTLRGTVYKRGGIVNFPLLEELRSKGDRVYSRYTKVRNKKVLDALMSYIIDDDGDSRIAGVRMSYGTSSTTAPNFDALIHAYANIIARLEVIVELFKPHLTASYELLHTDMSWVSLLDDLSVFKGIVPTLPGNEGDITDVAKETEVAQTTSQVTTRPEPKVREETVKAIQPKRSLAAPLHGDVLPIKEAKKEELAKTGIQLEPLSNGSRILSPSQSSQGVSDWANRNVPQRTGLPLTSSDNMRQPLGGRYQMQQRPDNVQSSRFNQAIMQQPSYRRQHDVLDIPLTNGTTTRMSAYEERQPMRGRNTDPYPPQHQIPMRRGNRDTPFGF